MSVALDVKVVVIGNPVYNGITVNHAERKEFSLYPNPAPGRYFYLSSSSLFGMLRMQYLMRAVHWSDRQPLKECSRTGRD